MRINPHPRIWTFDVDDTLVNWDRSEHPPESQVAIDGVKGPVYVVPHQKNINLLVKLAKVGWFIRVHSGSGVDWAERVVRALGLEQYVGEVCSKPLGRTDDKPPGDGLAYQAYRDPMNGSEK